MTAASSAAVVRFTGLSPETLPQLQGKAEEIGGPLIPNESVDAAIVPVEVTSESLTDNVDVVESLRATAADGLHQQAGSRTVIDLHGRLDRIVCLGCGALSLRADFQHELVHRNPGWDRYAAGTAPDGDADLDGVDFAGFAVPACPRCGGMLKPDVVFYGESVPRARVEAAVAHLHRSDGMLVVGSSLMVYSGFRFARMAAPNMSVLAYQEIPDNKQVTIVSTVGQN